MPKIHADGRVTNEPVETLAGDESPEVQNEAGPELDVPEEKVARVIPLKRTAKRR